MLKKCTGCLEEKLTSEFHKKNDGFVSQCRTCDSIRQKKARERRNPDDIKKTKEYLLEWRKNNKDKVNSIERKKYNAKWREANKEKIALQVRNYYLENKEYLKEVGKSARITNYQRRLEKEPLFAMKEAIRSNIRRTFNNKSIKKNTSTESILGCSYEEFKIYLESKFESWMNWENRGLYNGELNYGWDVDHIIPMSLAETEEDVLRLNHYSNLQPLCSKVNRDIKKDKII